MSRRTEDVATLRLVTLRRLVKATVPPLVFEGTATVDEVRAALREIPSATAVVIDECSVLQGTLRLDDIDDSDHDSRASDVMSRDAIVLEAENDPETARDAMERTGGPVLVVSPSGELLGVLTPQDLIRRAA